MYYVHFKHFKSELSLLQYCTSYVNIQSGGMMVFVPITVLQSGDCYLFGISEIQILSISKQLKKGWFWVWVNLTRTHL